jgi:hypothetical protein
MTIKISNEGEKLLLEAMVGKVAAGNLKLKLFTNNYTPADDDVVGDYTEMGAVQGYTDKTLAPASWNAGAAGSGVGTSLANKASITYPQQQWTFDGTGGSVTVYGYFITDAAGTVLVGAERFAAAQVVTTNGDTIKIDPKLTTATE